MRAIFSGLLGLPFLLVTALPLISVYAFISFYFALLLIFFKTSWLRLYPYEIAIVFVSGVSVISWYLNDGGNTTVLSLYLLCSVALIFVGRFCANRFNRVVVGFFYVAGAAAASVMLVLDDSIRASLFGLNANYVAYCIAMAGAVVFALDTELARLAVDQYRVPRFLVSVILMGLFFGGVLKTGSRGAVISLLFVTLLWLFIYFRKRPLFGIVFVALAAILVYWAYFELPDYIQNRLVYGDDSSGDISSGRYDAWAEALDFGLGNIFFGIGPGNFENLSLSKISVHNSFLSVFTEVGLVGLFWYLLCLFAFFVKLFRYGRLNKNSLGIVLFFSWLPIAFTGVWEVSFASWLLFGWFSSYLIENKLSAHGSH